MKIIADSACIISPNDGKEMGVTIIPVGILINNQPYKDYVEIQSEELLDKLNLGIMPTSS